MNKKQRETIDRLITSAKKDFALSGTNRQWKELDWYMSTAPSGDVRLKIWTNSKDNTGLLFLTDRTMVIIIGRAGGIKSGYYSIGPKACKTKVIKEVRSGQVSIS